MQVELDGKVALVCGASRGLGKACAAELARHRARVVICARDGVALRATARDIGSASAATVVPVVCDTSRADDLARLVETTVAQLSSLDILVANVGHPETGGFFDLAEDAWQTGFEQILLATVRLYQRVLPIMKARGWGRIVNIASSAIREPNSTYLLSGVFRSGSAWLSKALANQFGRDDITINTVCPGLFRTQLGKAILATAAARQETSLADAEADLAGLTAVGRIGEPEQLAGLVAFLCSDVAGHITGQTITIDGGKARGLF
ncbi:MAG: SDR family oxidoreductase [Proteobacteria bacterium]|nr:SDR family oxidoreductase [Pseudomonadota bacterium]